jgi:hypothetical protein
MYRTFHFRDVPIGIRQHKKVNTHIKVGFRENPLRDLTQVKHIE